MKEMRENIFEVCKSVFRVSFLVLSGFSFSGRIEVQLLEDEDQGSISKRYKLAAAIDEFRKEKQGNVKRTKYGSFISQRQSKPSKAFVTTKA
jgi:hypothetical protein